MSKWKGQFLEVNVINTGVQKNLPTLIQFFISTLIKALQIYVQEYFILHVFQAHFQ